MHSPKDDNPQQGGAGMDMDSSSSYPKRTFKVPPTRRDDRKLFVGGLPANITEDEFRDFFEQYGVLLDSIVMIDRETGRSRGFGFVTFEDPDVASNLLEMSVNGAQNGQNEGVKVGRVQMRGKLIEIKAAKPKEAGSNSYQGKGRRRTNHNGSPYRPPPHAQERFDMYHQGYPPMHYHHHQPEPGSPENGTMVNRGVPSSLNVPSPTHQQPPMMMHGAYGMVPPGSYYPPGAVTGMPMYAPPPYMGYPPDGAYYEQGMLDQSSYAPPIVVPPADSAMTVSAPGLISEQQAPPPITGYVPAGYGFVPVGHPPESPVRTTDNSPQSNDYSTGEEMNKE